jgi:hypothetical protein
MYIQKKFSLLGIVSIIFWLHINLEVQLGKYRSTRKVVDVYKKISLLDIVSIFLCDINLEVQLGKYRSTCTCSCFLFFLITEIPWKGWTSQSQMRQNSLFVC